MRGLAVDHASCEQPCDRRHEECGEEERRADRQDATDGEEGADEGTPPVGEGVTDPVARVDDVQQRIRRPVLDEDGERCECDQVLRVALGGPSLFEFDLAAVQLALDREDVVQVLGVGVLGESGDETEADVTRRMSSAVRRTSLVDMVSPTEVMMSRSSNATGRPVAAALATSSRDESAARSSVLPVAPHVAFDDSRAGSVPVSSSKR